MLQDPQYNQYEEQLNLVKDREITFVCKGRIEGFNTIFFPENLRTLHGRVGPTMTEVRQKYWVPKLWQLTKRLRYMCIGCKRFQATVFKAAVTGLLPKDRTEGSRAFKVIEADYAGRSYTLQAKFQEACTTLPIDKSVTHGFCVCNI